MQPKRLIIGAGVAAPLAVLGLISSMLLLLGPAKPAVADCGPAVSVVIDGNTKVEGYTQEQLQNAAAIMGAGKAQNLSVNGQMISVMVALGESGLRVLNNGDGAGPDSRGLFQQRDNGAWGSYADRMDPTTSATNFIQALKGVPGWELLEPTIAGNKVQRNADPYHYQRYWPEAVKLVQALSNSKSSLQGSDCAIPGQSGAGDDYPWKNSPTWLQVGANAASTSPLGMYYRECVDFALWRVNQQMGSTGAPFKFLNGSFRPDGQGLGSALEGRLGRQGLGIRQHTPRRRGCLVRARSRGSRPELRPRRGGQGSQGQRDLRRRGLQRQPGPGGPQLLHPDSGQHCPFSFPVPAHPRGEEVKKPLTLLAVALLCVSCAPVANTTPAPAESTHQPTASAPVSLSANSGPQAPGGTIPPTIGITWDQASKDQAVEVAGKAMADFARPTVEEKQWANDLARWLTPQATADYSAVDPANIPVSRVTGPAALSVDEANGFGVMAAVPTNAGTYTVQLLRTGKDAPWKVNRLTPPSS